MGQESKRVIVVESARFSSESVASALEQAGIEIAGQLGSLHEVRLYCSSELLAADQPDIGVVKKYLGDGTGNLAIQLLTTNAKQLGVPVPYFIGNDDEHIWLADTNNIGGDIEKLIGLILNVPDLT